MPAPSQECLDLTARYRYADDALARTGADGRVAHLDAVRLLVDLDAGVLAHGERAQVDAVFRRLCDGHEATGLDALLSRYLVFTLDAEETTALRLNKALDDPRFARRLAHRVLEANGLAEPATPAPAHAGASAH